MKTAIRIQTKADRNGNSRRGWVIMDELGYLMGFVSEVSSSNWIGNPGANKYDVLLPNQQAIPVTPSYFREMKRLEGKNQG